MAHICLLQGRAGGCVEFEERAASVTLSKLTRKPISGEENTSFWILPIPIRSQITSKHCSVSERYSGVRGEHARPWEQRCLNSKEVNRKPEQRRPPAGSGGRAWLAGAAQLW
jgi:hypothetical protein